MKQLLFASALYVSTKNCSSDDFIIDSLKTPIQEANDSSYCVGDISIGGQISLMVGMLRIENCSRGTMNNHLKGLLCQMDVVDCPK